MSNTSAADLFSNTTLVNTFGWLESNKEKSHSVTVKTLGGEAISGRVVQITSEYVAISYDDQFSGDAFSGTIIPLTAIASVGFHLPDVNKSKEQPRLGKQSRGDVA